MTQRELKLTKMTKVYYYFLDTLMFKKKNIENLWTQMFIKYCTRPTGY